MYQVQFTPTAREWSQALQVYRQDRVLGYTRGVSVLLVCAAIAGLAGVMGMASFTLLAVLSIAALIGIAATTFAAWSIPWIGERFGGRLTGPAEQLFLLHPAASPAQLRADRTVTFSFDLQGFSSWGAGTKVHVPWSQLRAVAADAELLALRHGRNEDLTWVPIRNLNVAAVAFILDRGLDAGADLHEFPASLRHQAGTVGNTVELIELLGLDPVAGLPQPRSAGASKSVRPEAVPPGSIHPTDASGLSGAGLPTAPKQVNQSFP